MPLSEEELRLLEQMERALVAEDPKLASTLRGTTQRRAARRRMILGIVAFLAGIAVLMTGAVMRLTVVGIAGFVVMLASAYLVLVSWKGQQQQPTSAEGAQTAGGGAFGLSVVQGGKASKRPRVGRRSSSSSSGSFMDRMEERWRRRRDQNGGF